jgi:hypothetical protein
VGSQTGGIKHGIRCRCYLNQLEVSLCDRTSGLWKLKSPRVRNEMTRTCSQVIGTSRALTKIRMNYPKPPPFRSGNKEPPSKVASFKRPPVRVATANPVQSHRLYRLDVWPTSSTTAGTGSETVDNVRGLHCRTRRLDAEQSTKSNKSLNAD